MSYDLMMDAIGGDNSEKVKQLIAEGVDVAEAHVHGDTAFLLSAHCGQIRIMNWHLYEGSCDQNGKASDGTSALSLAAMMAASLRCSIC
jgi:ankyrin repeat protein